MGTNAPTDGEAPEALGRRLLRAADRAVLSTVDGAGHPYASLVLLACGQDAAPLLLISSLAEHTKNIARDPRISLLIDGTAGHDDPLTGPRLTVLGEAEPCTDAECRARFLARHPSARRYAGFADFAFHRVAVSRGHLVAGFGRIDWIEGEALRDRLEPALAEAEPDIVAHMNADHAEALDLCAHRLLGLTGDGWQLTGVDPQGCDLRRHGNVARMEFPARVRSPHGARDAFVALVKEARAAPAA